MNQPVHIRDIKKGDELYEYGQGRTMPLNALEDARRILNTGLDGEHRGWECICARADGGSNVRLYVADCGQAYEPHLFRRERTVAALRPEDV